MPLFYFILKAGRQTYPDVEGQEFRDEAAAREHAHAVARELMRNRETETSHWRIQVCDDYLEPCYECLFADIDETWAGCDGKLRRSLTAVARTTTTMGDALRNIDSPIADLRQTLSLIDTILSSSHQLNHIADRSNGRGRAQ